MSKDDLERCHFVAGLVLGANFWNLDQAIVDMKKPGLDLHARVQGFIKQYLAQARTKIGKWLIGAYLVTLGYVALMHDSPNFTDWFNILCVSLVWVAAYHNLSPVISEYLNFKTKFMRLNGSMFDAPSSLNFGAFRDYLNANPDVGQIANQINQDGPFQYCNFAQLILCRQYLVGRGRDGVYQVGELLAQ